MIVIVLLNAEFKLIILGHAYHFIPTPSKTIHHLYLLLHLFVFA